jgi:predicted nucleic acid-binding protein
MAEKILVDVNICLDLLLDRKPFIEDSGHIFELGEKDKINLLLSAISVDTLFYVIRPTMGATKATETIRDLLKITNIAPVTAEVIDKALAAKWNDLEDAIQYYTADYAGCTHLITRNKIDFKKADARPIIQTPLQFLQNREEQQ